MQEKVTQTYKSYKNTKKLKSYKKTENNNKKY